MCVCVCVCVFVCVYVCVAVNPCECIRRQGSKGVYWHLKLGRGKLYVGREAKEIRRDKEEVCTRIQDITINSIDYFFYYIV